MGKYDQSLYRYLDDNQRFADLFNAVHFKGLQVVRPEDLREASEKYVEAASRKDGKSKMRYRDLKKQMQNGTVLRILAVEAQNRTDYTMPWRVMNYDNLEYEKQIQAIKSQNEQTGKYASEAERLCKFHSTDRLSPVYTICIYHGQEPWDGPKSLGEMMDFGLDKEALQWRQLFNDYPLRLLCISEPMDYSLFHTSLRLLFAALPMRDNKDGLRQLFQNDSQYKHLDRDTMEVIAVMTNNQEVLQDMENYVNENDNEGRYNMCKALEDLKLEGREEGRKEGREEGLQEGQQAGESRMAKLVQLLIAANRIADLTRASEDIDYRSKLFVELGL